MQKGFGEDRPKGLIKREVKAQVLAVRVDNVS